MQAACCWRSQFSENLVYLPILPALYGFGAALSLPRE
jgi:hypothetical protein